MASCECECWVLVTTDGEWEAASTAEAAREAFEQHTRPLAEVDGFRLVRVSVTVPVPEVVSVEVEVEAPARGGPGVKGWTSVEA